MQRDPLISMVARDLSDLYSSLELFRKTYVDCDDEVERLLQSVASIYMRQYGTDSLAALRNSRGAGRKCSYPEGIREQVAKMRQQGKSYREISRESGIPRSTLQRLMVNDEVSRN